MFPLPGTQRFKRARDEYEREKKNMSDTVNLTLVPPTTQDAFPDTPDNLPTYHPTLPAVSGRPTVAGVSPAMNNEVREWVASGLLVYLQFPTRSKNYSAIWSVKYVDEMKSVISILNNFNVGQLASRAGLDVGEVCKSMEKDFLLPVRPEDPARCLVAEFNGTHNYRLKRGGSTLSLHSYAIAIDLNASKNPMVARPWTTKSYQRALWLGAFKPSGFAGWGGNFRKTADDMHFSIVFG